MALLIACNPMFKFIQAIDPSQQQQLRHDQGGSTVSALQVARILDGGAAAAAWPGGGDWSGREYELARGMVGGE